jgi:TRAP-type mannitol/chloroaromatic compound transport system permease small subunit
MPNTIETADNGPSLLAKSAVKALDSISTYSGKIIAFLMIPMMYALVHEVISRYYFNAPTIWAGDVALILYGILFMIASPYCLKEGMHIRTDFLYSRWSTKSKGRIDFFTYIFLYFPTHIVFLKVGWDFFYKSFRHNEVIISSPWMPIIWPLKFALPLSIALMILQGISETIKSYYAWRHGQFYWEHHEHASDDAASPCDISTNLE